MQEKSKINLFPKNPATRQWVQFPADGFTKPVSGVIYHRGEVMPGMPLGALGTGFISLGTDGTLDYYSTIFNAFMERQINTLANYNPSVGENADLSIRRHHVPTERLPFLGMSIDGKTWVLTTKAVNWSLPQVNHAHDIEYWGHYPVADLQYQTDAPIEVSMRAWSPFLPGCAEDSNTPGAVFEVRLHNITKVTQKGTIAFSFHGPREFETDGTVYYFRKQVQGNFTGTVVSSKYAPDKLIYALGVIGKQKVRTGGEIAGASWQNITGELPSAPPTHSGATVAVDFELQPKASQTIRFVLSWFCPNFQAEERAPFPGIKGVNDEAGLAWYQSNEDDQPDTMTPERSKAHYDRRYWSHSRLKHMYASRFDSALDVANHLARNHESLLRRILAWQEVIYAEEKLPSWLRDSLVNILAILAQESFWVQNADANHWWGPDGIFVVNESLLSCPQLACIANDQAGEWPINLFFPQLSRNKLRVFKHYQKDNGQTPSTLGSGTEPDGLWYDQQLPMDGQIYVHLIDRIWQSTGDDNILEDFYTSVKDGIHFMQTVDFDGDALLDVKGNNQLYDNWPTMAGAAIHVSGYWIATLHIALKMAEKMGDKKFAEECKAWIKRGSESIESKLWNDSAGSYLLYHQPETGVKSDSILSDQLSGQWFAHLHGLSRVFSEDRVRTVLETIWKYNVSIAKYGVRTAIKPDLTTDMEGFYSSRQCPSYSSLTPAMVMIYSGDAKRGLDLMHSIWNKLVIEKSNAWDMPCQMTADGDVAFGLEYYHNTMLWTLPIAVLGQSLRTFCGPQGLANRIIAAASG